MAIILKIAELITMGKNYNVAIDMPEDLLSIPAGEICFCTMGGGYGIYRDNDYNFYVVKVEHQFSYIPSKKEIIPLLNEDATCEHHASGKLYMAYRGNKIVEYLRGDKDIVKAILNDKGITDATIVEFDNMLEVMDFIKKNKLK